MDNPVQEEPRPRRVTLHASRPDIVALKQLATLVPPVLVDADATWRWTRDGITLRHAEDAAKTPAPITVFGQPGRYAFERYDRGAARWVADVRWDVVLAGGALAVLTAPGPLNTVAIQGAAQQQMPRDVALRHYALVHHDSTPVARWNALADRVAASAGAAMPAVYATPAFYWMPPDVVSDQLDRFANEYGDPTTVPAEEDATPLRRALDRVFATSELSAKAAAIHVLLRDVLYWWHERIDPLDDVQLLALWTDFVLSLDFFAPVRSVLDTPVDPAEPADRARLYAWLAMHRAARAQPPHLDLLAQLAGIAPPVNGGALPSAPVLARHFGLPLQTAYRIVDPLRADTPASSALPGVYAGAALATASARAWLVAYNVVAGGALAPAQLLFAPAGDARVPESSVRTGSVFPSASAAPIGTLAGAVHYLWFRGDVPARAQFAAFSDSNVPVLAVGGGRAAPVVRLPGDYSLWAMQQLRGERDDEGAPLVRWALLARLHASGPALTAAALLRAADVHIEEDMLLTRDRPFVLPHSRLTGRALGSWMRQPLDGKGPLVDVPPDAVRTLEPLPRDETALQGIYHAVQPIVSEPLLAAALVASAAPSGEVGAASSRAAVLARIDVAQRALAPPLALDARSIVMRFVQLLANTGVRANLDALAGLARAEQARVLLTYYRAVLAEPFGAQLLPDDYDAQPVLDLVETVARIAVYANANVLTVMRSLTDGRPRLQSPETARLALVARAAQYAPGYLPFLAELMHPDMDAAAFLDAIDEHHTVLLDFMHVAAVQAAAVEPALPTADVRRMVLEEAAGAANPPVAPQIGPPQSRATQGFTRSTSAVFLRGMKRNVEERQRRGAAGPPGRAAPTPFVFGSGWGATVTQAALGLAYAADVGGGWLLDVADHGTAPSRAVLVGVLLRTLLRARLGAPETHVPLPLYVHVVHARPHGVDATTGTPYDVVDAAWGDAVWRACEADRAHAPPDADAVAAWFAERTEPATPHIRPAPLYRVLWEGAHRDWPARAHFAGALAQLEAFAEALETEAARVSGRAFAPPGNVSANDLYATLVRLYPSSPAGTGRKRHPALESGGTGLALDYVRTLSRGAVRALAQRYGLADALPDLRFVQHGPRAAVPETAWIGRPSSWHVGPVLDADIVAQARGQLEAVQAARDDPDLSDAERARRIAAVHAQPLRWNSRRVDLHNALQTARHHTWLAGDENGVPSARLPWLSGGGPPNLAAGLGST